MKSLILLFIGVVSIGVGAQGNYELQQIHATQKFYLTNSTKAAYADGDHRMFLAVPLPKQTKEWYYSFSAMKNSTGVNMNLYTQLINLVEPSGLSASVLNVVAVPAGNIRCNIYLTNEVNAIAFDRDNKDLDQGDYFSLGSRMNYTEGTVRVTDHIGNVVYVCCENPGSWIDGGITVFIEVVALVDTSKYSEPIEIEAEKKSEEEVISEAIGELVSVFDEHKKQRRKENQLAAQSSNNLTTGWVFYEAGDFDNSLNYSKKALEMNQHPQVYFNLGLAYWCKQDEQNCMDSYLKGLNLVYDLESKEEALNVLGRSISDIYEGKEGHKYYAETPPALKLLEIKLNEIKSLDKWKNRY